MVWPGSFFYPPSHSSILVPYLVVRSPSPISAVFCYLFVLSLPTAHCQLPFLISVFQFQLLISILMAEGLLKPLGRPPATDVKYFSAAALEELRRDEQWLARASDCVVHYWKARNEIKKAQHGKIHAAPCIAPLAPAAAALN